MLKRFVLIYFNSLTTIRQKENTRLVSKLSYFLLELPYLMIKTLRIEFLNNIELFIIH